MSYTYTHRQTEYESYSMQILKINAQLIFMSHPQTSTFTNMAFSHSSLQLWAFFHSSLVPPHAAMHTSLYWNARGQMEC